MRFNPALFSKEGVLSSTQLGHWPLSANFLCQLVLSFSLAADWVGAVLCSECEWPQASHGQNLSLFSHFTHLSPGDPAGLCSKGQAHPLVSSFEELSSVTLPLKSPWRCFHGGDVAASVPAQSKDLEMKPRASTAQD